MANNKGKAFEEQLKKDWAISMPGSFLLRLQDSQSGYFGTSSNPCDFIGYQYPYLFLIECKSTKENTFSLYSINKKTGLKNYNFRQYEKLLEYKNIKGVAAGIVLWFIEHDKVVWVNIKEIEKMVNDGNKSINIKMLTEGMYNIVEIPSIKKRTFMTSDYKVLMDLGGVNG